jgi:hypothetical protein
MCQCLAGSLTRLFYALHPKLKEDWAARFLLQIVCVSTFLAMPSKGQSDQGTMQVWLQVGLHKRRIVLQESPACVPHTPLKPTREGDRTNQNDLEHIRQRPWGQQAAALLCRSSLGARRTCLQSGRSDAAGCATPRGTAQWTGSRCEAACSSAVEATARSVCRQVHTTQLVN